MNLRNSTVKAIATFFSVGYLPLIPGTFGSLAGLILYYLVKDNQAVFILLTLLIIALGFIVSGRVEKIIGRKDPSCIVIDEVGGMLLSLWFVPYSVMNVWITFLVFRLLDTFKPFPAGRIQNLKGSLGIMADDLIAAIYTNIVIQLALRLAFCRAS